MVPARQETPNGALWGQAEHAVEGKPRRKSSWQTTIESFTPVWFTLAMNTGILGILMWNLPYQFNGLHIIATIMYVADIIIFAAAMITTLLRWGLYPMAARRKVMSNFSELCMHGAMPIAFLTIVALTALIPSNAPWGHHTFTILAYVLWWIATAWMLVTAIVVNMIVFKSRMASDRTMTPALFLPAVGLSTDAVVGALMCRYSYGISARLAVPVLITGYLLNGLAIWISIVIYTLYFHHLMTMGMPEPTLIPAMWLLVGPYGQTAAALLLTGDAAETKMQFAEYNKGTFLTASGATSASGADIIIALLLLGFDLFWVCVCTWTLLEGAWKRQLSYTLFFWSLIFPKATVTTTCIVLSSSLDSPAFRALSAGLLLLLVIEYVLNWCFTLYHGVTGSLLIKPPEDEVTEDRKDN